MSTKKPPKNFKDKMTDKLTSQSAYCATVFVHDRL